MSTTAAPVGVTGAAKTISMQATKTKKRLTSPWASLAAVIIAILWTLPTFGLLITSIRPVSDINSSGWWTFFTNPAFTLDNYKQVLDTQTSGTTLSQAFINSVVITLPAVVIPICLASLASYAFAWIEFKGRDFLFVLVFALQIVPIQVTLIPLLSLFVKLNLAGTFWPVWISHSIFALPLAIFLLHNFMKEVPRELIEAARVDGAGHVKIFFQVLMPLLTPAIAAFGIFQFLWVWNDLLVAITFASDATTSPMTVLLQNMTGTRGSSWFLLSAGAFISIALPLAVFLSMQRFFVRGLLAGSVKG
ncbi:MAG: alpha-glucoside transport system permease protein [Actinomycetota bacterium]|jgi:alpha-glucoside transport system permease protein|nr:alpha-glucoside transport system permease protein [Actinomycetota bacterium]MDQ1666405.1 alpha-glucoside transport system permease protein [Actinomycetota bacterium]